MRKQPPVRLFQKGAESPAANSVKTNSRILAIRLFQKVWVGIYDWTEETANNKIGP